MADFFVVAYDIPDDKRRTKLFKKMFAFGTHTQYSVFECYLDKKELNKMVKEIRRVINPDEDDIKIYRLCSTCVKQTIVLGKGKLSSEEGVIVI